MRPQSVPFFRTAVRFLFFGLLVLVAFSSAQQHSQDNGHTSGGTGSAPAAPTGLTAQGGLESAALSWTASSGATSYYVFQSPSGNSGTFTNIGTSSTTTFPVTSLADGTTYYFEVEAHNSYGTSGPSNVASALTFPPAPTNLTATGGLNQITLAWSSALSATYYTVYQSTSISGTYSSIGNTTQTTYTQTGLAAGTTYYYKVGASNASGGPGNLAGVASAITIPPVPTGLTATAGASSIALSWNSSAGASSYTVLCSNSGTAGTFTSVGSSSSTSYSYSYSGQQGSTYWFEVEAVDASGSSGPSNVASATIPPGPPTNLTATGGLNCVTLGWSNGAGAAVYNIWRSTSAGGPYTFVASVSGIPLPGGQGRFYTDSGLAWGTTYYYELYSSTANGVVSLTYAGPVSALTLPAAPPYFTATGGDTQVTLMWGTVLSATSYTVSILTGPGGSPTQSWTITGLSQVVTGLADNVTYYFSVYATNATGNGPSSTANAETTSGLSAPTLTATPGVQQVMLNWTNLAGATYYLIYKSTTNNGSFNAIATVTTNSYLDTAVVGGTTYYYEVCGYTANNGQGPMSNVASATPYTDFTFPNNPVVNQYGFLNQPMALPNWMDNTIPTDESGSPGAGPSSALSVSLPFGVLESDCGPDIVTSDPSPAGPSISFERTYRSVLDAAGISSPGLPSGWTDNWDYQMIQSAAPTQTTPWPSLYLLYPSGAYEQLYPNVDVNGNLVYNDDGTTVRFTVVENQNAPQPTHVPFHVDGTPELVTPTGTWSSIVISTDATHSTTFSPLGQSLIQTQTYRPTSFEAGTNHNFTIQYALSPIVFGTTDFIESISGTGNDADVTLTFNYGGQNSNQVAAGSFINTITDANGRFATINCNTSSIVNVITADGESWNYGSSQANGAGPFHLATVQTPYLSSSVQATVNYDANNRVSSVVDADGNVRQYSYQEWNTRVNVATGPHFAANPQIIDDTFTESFNSCGQITASQDAAGDQSTLQYNSANPAEPSYVHVPLCAPATQVSDSHGNPTEIVHPYGDIVWLTWEYAPSFPQGHLRQIQQQSANSGPCKAPIEFFYYTPGTAGGYDDKVQYAYLPTPGTTYSGGQYQFQCPSWTVCPACTVQISYTYTSSGDIATITEPGPNSAGTSTTTFAYASNGSLASVTDPAGLVTQFNFTSDADGRLTQITDPLANNTSLTYNGNSLDQIASLTFPDGSQIQNKVTNDEKPPSFVSLLNSSGALQKQTAYQYGWEYNPTLATTTSASGSFSNQIQQGVTSEFLLGQVTNGYGINMQSFVYTPTSNTTTNNYGSGSDQVQSTAQADAAGNPLTATDPSGQTTSFSNQGGTDDRPTSAVLSNSAGNASMETDISYDAFGRVSSISYPEMKDTEAYAYDDLDNVTSVTTTNSANTFLNSAATATVSYAYNTNGQRASMSVSAGGSSPNQLAYSYAYDSDGRVQTIQLSYPGYSSTLDTLVSYTYDNDGRVASCQTAGLNTYYTYNSLGQVTELDNAAPFSATGNYPTFNSGAAMLLSKYTGIGYDASGNLTSMQFTIPSPAGQQGANYSPGNDLSGSVAFTYDPLDELTNENWAFQNFGSVAFSHSYDGAGNLTQLRNNSLSTDNNSDELQFGSLPNLTSQEALYTLSYSDPQAPSGSPSAALGNMGTGIPVLSSPILNNNGSGYSFSWPIDQASVSFNGYATGWAPNEGDQFVATDNMTLFQDTSQSNGVMEAYFYRGDGLRTAKAFGGTVGTNGETSYLPNQTFIYDGDRLIAQLVPNGQTYMMQYAYIWGPTGIIARVTPSSTYNAPIYYAYDPMGNRVGRHPGPNTDGTAPLITACDQTVFDGYGSALLSLGSPATPLMAEYGPQDPIGYKGQVGCFTDWESGLVYCQHRYYSPLLGRWLSQDPSGLEGGINEYEFCGNNPTNFSDFTGNGPGPAQIVAQPLDTAPGWFTRAFPALGGGSSRLVGSGMIPGIGWCIFAAQAGWTAGTYIDQQRGVSDVEGPYIAGAYAADDDGLNVPNYPHLKRIWNNSDDEMRALLEEQYPTTLGRYAAMRSASPNTLIHWHHLVPQQFQSWATSRGVNIHDPQLLAPLYLSPHQVVHGKGGGPKWNADWDLFKNANPLATPDQIIEYTVKLRAKYGI